MIPQTSVCDDTLCSESRECIPPENTLTGPETVTDLGNQHYFLRRLVFTARYVPIFAKFKVDFSATALEMVGIS